MDLEIITAISNTAGEYRKYADRLTSILEHFDAARKDADEEDKTLDTAANRISSEIRELFSMAQALEDIAQTYRRSRDLMDGMDVYTGKVSPDTEFGTSEFANLSKHEKLMPIHSA